MPQATHDTSPDFALQLLEEDGVSLSLPARFVAAVVDGLTHAASQLGAVLQQVDLRGGTDRVDAQLTFMREDERRLSLGQRSALMAAALEVIDSVIAPASRRSWLPG